MAEKLSQSIRPRRSAIVTGFVIVVVALLGWGYLRGTVNSVAREPVAPSSTPATTSQAAPSATPTNDADTGNSPIRSADKPAGRLIDVLRQQIAQSPILQDDDAQSSLLNSLDQAGDLWTRTQRENRDALRQLNRQVRIGEQRQAPNLVLITFERAPEQNTTASPRDQLFARLKDRGASFTQHYAGGESPSSGWWTLMTGRNAGRAVDKQPRFSLRESHRTLATELWQAGYTTGMYGTWHDSAAPITCGFDDWTGLWESQDPIALYPTRLSTARSQMTIRANADAQQNVALWKLLNIEISSWLKSQQNSTRPFYLQLRLPELPPMNSNLDEVNSAESLVEQTLSELQNAGLDSRTCVFITTLSGPANAAPLSEQSLLVPLVMVGGHADNLGRTIPHPTAAWDLLPTFLDIALATRRETATDGRSLLANSAKSSLAQDRLLYWETDDGTSAQAVRKGDWKGTATKGDRELRLYHLPSDPREEKNVASDHPDIVQQLLAPKPSQAVSASEPMPN